MAEKQRQLAEQERRRQEEEAKARAAGKEGKPPLLKEYFENTGGKKPKPTTQLLCIFRETPILVESAELLVISCKQ